MCSTGWGKVLCREIFKASALWADAFYKIWVFGYSWSTLLWYRCYYPHRSRDALSPVCRIFILRKSHILCHNLNIMPYFCCDNGFFLWFEACYIPHVRKGNEGCVYFPTGWEWAFQFLRKGKRQLYSYSWKDLKEFVHLRLGIKIK